MSWTIRSGSGYASGRSNTRVHYSKDCGIGSNSESQRKHGYNRKVRVFTQRA